MESSGVNRFSETDIRKWLQFNGLSVSLACFDGTLGQLRSGRFDQGRVLDICLSTECVGEWIGYAFASIVEGHCLWFCSPKWKEREWIQVQRIFSADLHLGDTEAYQKEFAVEAQRSASRKGSVMIATGGSSGAIKFAQHSIETMSSAVDGMSRFFFERPMREGDFCYQCDLPLWHVSGWMQLFRSFLSNSVFLIGGAVQEPVKGQTKWLSMVPVQLKRALNEGHYDELKAYDFIVLGGGACPEGLLKECLAHEIHPWVTYGMTETAGMVAGKQVTCAEDIDEPADLFPHVRLRIDELEELASEHKGEIVIESDALCLGYNLECGNPFEKGFRTRDVGFLDCKGRLEVVDRLDSIINTGGEKVLPKEVKDIILSHKGVEDCLVLGVEDPQWGHKVIAIVALEQHAEVDQEELKCFLQGKLSVFKIPKEWKIVDCLPYDEKGKLSKRAITQIVESY